MAPSIPSLADRLLPRILIRISFEVLLIGTFLGLVLYGILLHQVSRYRTVYSSDKLDLKVAVYLILALETTFMALSCYTCFQYLVLGQSAAYIATPSLFLQPLTALILGTLHAFFARRVYLFDIQRRRVVLAAVVLLLVDIGFAVATPIVEYHYISTGSPARQLLSGRAHVMILSALGVGLCVDITFTTVLAIALRQKRRGVERMDLVMRVLFFSTLSTGLITGISLLSLFLQVVISPHDVGEVTGISIIVTPLFANIFLAMLNSRQWLNDQIEDGESPTEISNTASRKDLEES